jgi:predicted MFS family arabinose efflux permease
VTDGSARPRESVASWLGLNRATVAVLIVIGCLGLSEEIWMNFLSLYLKDRFELLHAADAVAKAAIYIGIIGFGKNLLEGFGYIIGGTVAHRMGPRVALAVSGIPMAIGFTLMLTIKNPVVIIIASFMLTNWEPLSVPATFDVVGSEVPKQRRTIAFAVQSIQKRLPKVIGPPIGALVMAAVGYWLNLAIAFGLVGLSASLQLMLMSRMKPKPEGEAVPLRKILAEMPKPIRMLLSAEIFIRWGDWFAREFAVLYVATILVERWAWTKPDAVTATGTLLGITSFTALVTYIPMAKWIDRSDSPKPFIGMTFFLFAIFPIMLVLVPRFCLQVGVPVMAGLALVYVVNGLRELGEPARKALIATAFPSSHRARAVGLYWGLRSFAFCPAPFVAALLWQRIGPDATFLIGGSIGLMGTAWYAVSNRQSVIGNR